MAFGVGGTMRIGPSLILASRQTLAMTPQLQQAIKLLQFSHLELAAFIQQELEKNPLLSEGAADDGPIAEAGRARPRCAGRHGRGAGGRGAGAGRSRRALDARACRPRRRRHGQHGRPARGRARCARFRRRPAALARGPCARADRPDVRRRRRAAHRAEARRRSRRSGLLPPRRRRRRRGGRRQPRDGRGRVGAPAPDRAGRPVLPHASPSAWAPSSPSAIASIRR